MHKPDCLFCKIVQGQVPCHKVWESATHLAFLSIFPNTPGFTVVTSKEHYNSYAFGVEDQVLTELVLATKQVAQVLDGYFDDVSRCGMFFEGYGVDHLHAKLFPMHGAGQFYQGGDVEVARPTVFFNQYPGYLSSHDAARADDAQLAELAAKIRASQQSR